MNQDKKSKTSNIIVIILIIIIIGLAAFIIYDKLIKSEKPSEQVVEEPKNELVAFNENQFTESDSQEDIYFKTLTYKNNNLKIDFKLYMQNETDESGYLEKVMSNILVNDKKVKTIILTEFRNCENKTECDTLYDSLDEAKSAAITRIKEGLGTIKTDKYYLYIIFDGKHVKNENNEEYNDIFFVNENGKVIDENIKYTTLLLNPNISENVYYTCKYVHENKPNYEVTADAIYYLKMSKHINDAAADIANEYKITVKNDKIVNEKVDTCEVFPVNNPFDYSEYEDM